MVESLGGAESIFNGQGGSSWHDSMVGGKENWPQSIKSAQRDFREELKKLYDVSYLCDDMGTFESSTEVLANLRKSFESHCNREHGLVLNKQHDIVMFRKDREVLRALPVNKLRAKKKQKQRPKEFMLSQEGDFHRCM